ncbi:MAG: PAS domain S-box protein, partial [Chloroflexi bacterium]|nr:PAS domain S-box protein [Chloroflexota bacterium]
MKTKSVLHSTHTVRYALLGWMAGAGLPIAGTLVHLPAHGLPLTAGMAVRAHLSDPMLWLLDTVPWVLGAVAALAGSRQDRLAGVAAELEQKVAERTAELSRTNAELRQENAERERASAEIGRQKQYFEALVQNSPLAIVTLDLQQRVVACNPAFERLFGYTRQEAAGREIDALVAGEASRDEALGYTRRVIAGDVVHGIGQRVRKDGAALDVEIFGVPVVVAGEQVGVLALYHDITRQRQAEAELQRQKQFFEALVQNSPVAIVTLDLQEQITSCNPAFESLFGYRQSDVLGCNLDDLIASPEARMQATTFTHQAMAGQVAHGTGKRRRKDGGQVEVEVFGVPVLVAGERVGAVGLYHNISDLMRARREAEEADRAKSEFLANMSH